MIATPLDMIRNTAAGADTAAGSRNLAARRLHNLAAAAGLAAHIYGDGTVELSTVGPAAVFVAVSSDIYTAAKLVGDRS